MVTKIKQWFGKSGLNPVVNFNLYSYSTGFDPDKIQASLLLFCLPLQTPLIPSSAAMMTAAFSAMPNVVEYVF
jgi:hypothetical protein